MWKELRDKFEAKCLAEMSNEEVDNTSNASEAVSFAALWFD